MAVQIILKNSSIEDKRPSASQLTNGEISLNYNETGAFLCCTDSSGEVQQVGGVKIDDDAPDAPVKQTLWFKPSTLTLSVYDGDKWLPIAGGGGGGGGGGDIIQIIGNDGIDADTVAGIVTLDVELAGGDDGLEFKSSKLSATLASATDLGSVKVGENINVTAGKISVPKATSSTFGVVKVGDGLAIAGDGSLIADVPKTTTYRGSCDLNNSPTGQLNPDPALKGDAYINSAETASIEADWTPLTGTAEIGDLVIFDGAEWQLIPIGSGTAPVTSVNTKVGDVVLDYTDVGAASAAQGALADTALQSGDNISELTNDEGYIKAAEAPVISVNGEVGAVVLDAADVGALAAGDDVSKLANDAGYITLAEVPPFPDQEPPVIISATAPTGDDAVEGNLWFNSDDGRTYVYYKDGDSSQWIDASPDSGGAGGGDGLWLEAGGSLSPKTGTNGVDIGGSNILLNADGTSVYTSAASTTSWRISPAQTVGGNDLLYVGDLSSNGGSDNSAGIIRKPNGTSALVVYNTVEESSGDLNNASIAVFSSPDKATGKTPRFAVYPDGSSEHAGDMAIGTTGSFTPSTPAISLNADGSINAKSIEGGENLAAAADGYGFICSANSTTRQGNIVAGSTTADQGVFSGFLGATRTSSLKADGTMYLGGVVPSAANITLRADGSADFVKGKIQLKDGSGGSTIRVNTFPGSGDIGKDEAAVLIKSNGDTSNTTYTGGHIKLATFRTSAFTSTTENVAFEVRETVDSNPQISKVKIHSHGRATFGKVDTSATDAVGVEWNPGGASIVIRTQGTSAINGTQTNGYELYKGNTMVYSINYAGTAAFSNAIFNLEAEDDTKYTATTNGEGGQTLVYNGATLDVKDRLQKADAALLALKAAAVAASDFASLKAAIVTALADI